MFSYKISGGNSNATPTAFAPKDITFYDYDGTIVASWTLEELATKTALPDYPSHEGLTCQGWNWSLDDLKTTNRKMDVGAMYITDDGKTRIYIRLEEGRISPMLGVCPNGTVTVDWGDGTTPDTLTGTSITNVKWTPNHAYAAPGEYVIKLTVDGTMGFYGYPSSGQYSTILRYLSNKDNRNIAYQNSVQKIEIGNSVTSIGRSAFSSCNSLVSITVPNSVTSIEGSAFDSCYSLVSITIPNSVTTIRGSAFHECYSLSSITIPNSVTSTGDYMFAGCYSLSSITIPDSITSIEPYTFSSCNSLSSITIPDSITNIGEYAFANCYSLSSITIPNGVTSIKLYTFYMCYSLASITIPDSITSIGNYTFYDCYSLASITIPNGITTIGESAFYECYSLSSITIPDSVTSIASNAFYNCYSVTFYDFSNHTSIPTLSSTNAFASIAADCRIRVPASLYDTWKVATNWSTYADYIVPMRIYVPSIPNTYGLINNSKTIEVSLINYSAPPKCSIKITSGNSITIANDLQITNEKISFSISMVKTGSSTIALNITGEGVTYERSFTITVYETLPKSTATVIAVDGAAYGFALNSSGYYESQNKGVNNSYALCRVNIFNPLNKKLYFDCINSGESGYDYGLLGAVNQELAKKNTADVGVKQSFKGKSSTSVQTVEYDDATGNCFIDIKFIKDSSSNSGNDSLQFKIRMEETT